MMPARKDEPKNVAGIRKWVADHRPDVLPYVENIMEYEGHDKHLNALFFLMSIGFAAGREYQQEHPTDNEP